MRYWLHNEWVLLDAQKIAKSSGQYPAARRPGGSGLPPDGLPAVPARRPLPQPARLHHDGDGRRPGDAAPPGRPGRAAAPAARAWRRYDAGARARRRARATRPRSPTWSAIDAAIASDLATPKLLATLQEALRDPDITAEGLRVVVAAADALLGLRPRRPRARRGGPAPSRPTISTPAEVAAIERLIAERTQARKERNWARADEIRAELDALGVQVTDTPAGPTWQLR